MRNTASLQNVDACGEDRAYLLLETARLRCEQLMPPDRPSPALRAIHRELGMAAFVTSEPLNETRRHQLLSVAHSQVTPTPRAGSGARQDAEGPPPTRILARMFADVISASDALATELGDPSVDELHRDHLHLVHAHVMSACELLDERLTELELSGTG